MRSLLHIVGGLLVAAVSVIGQVPQNPGDFNGPWEPGSEVAPFEQFHLVEAPQPGSLLLQPGDRLAIIGDSITEQKMYSRIIETYLTVCVPELKITTRQFGWSGETAEGFARRMTNDCLRFGPTIATLCYGMNDHRYRTYDPANGEWYQGQYGTVVRSLKDAGARVVLGSPGCVGKVPGWTQSDQYTLNDLNQNLATFRNIDVALAARENVRFADVFWPMLKADAEARQRYGPDYAVAGKDGVHPGWAGQLIMAWTYLRSMGLDGDLGSVTVDLAQGQAGATGGHEVKSFSDGTVSLVSTRYPFCATGASDKDDSIRSGMTLVPFNQELNRFILKLAGAGSGQYAVTWGGTTREYSAVELSTGINLAANFPVNPFSDAFNKVDEAVFRKQEYETRQIKTLFHGREGSVDMDATVALTEKARQPLVDAIGRAFVPVNHQLKIVPVK